MKSAHGSWRAAATGLLFLPLVPAPLAHAQQREPVYRTEIGVVVVHATVKNARGEVVTNLDRSAFTVYENGKRQEITAFSREDVPVSLGIALDHSRSMRFSRSRVELAARALAGASSPRDEIFLLDFADKPNIAVPFTSDVHALLAQIGRVDCIGGTALRDAVLAGETYLVEHGQRERKVLVLISDGCDNSSAASSGEVRELCRRSQVVVHAIGLLNEDDTKKADRGREELDEICTETGGIAFYSRATEHVDVTALELARQIRSQYTIGYSPTNQSLDGSYRKIRVVAKGAERLSVNTRAGYRAVAGRPVTQKPDDAPAARPRPARKDGGAE